MKYSPNASESKGSLKVCNALPDRMPQLDGLRVFAVAAVAAYHWLPESKLKLAGYGVQLFFVLSGFLITGILLDVRRSLQEHSIKDRWFSLRQFYIRRILRIFPLYYLTLAGALFVGFVGVRESWAWHALYLSNVFFFLNGDWLGPAAHFWSLAVEEQFYIFWPLLILFLPKRFLFTGIVLTIGSAPAFRVAASLLWADCTMARFLMPGCLDALGIGAFLAYGARHFDAITMRGVHRGLFVLGGCGLIACIVFQSKQLRLLGECSHTFIAAILGSLIFAAANGIRGPIGGLLQFPVLVYLGKISYALYVFHNFAPACLRIICRKLSAPDELWTNTPLRIALLTAMTILGAVASWHLVEGPINGLKRYFPYVRRRLVVENHGWRGENQAPHSECEAKPLFQNSGV